MKISSSCERSSYLPLNQLIWHEKCETLRLCGLALEDVRLFRDALSWLEDQAGQRYGNAADTGRLIGVEIDVW